jgi:hypothetical protein
MTSTSLSQSQSPSQHEGAPEVSSSFTSSKRLNILTLLSLRNSNSGNWHSTPHHKTQQQQLPEMSHSATRDGNNDKPSINTLSAVMLWADEKMRQQHRGSLVCPPAEFSTSRDLDCGNHNSRDALDIDQFIDDSTIIEPIHNLDDELESNRDKLPKPPLVLTTEKWVRNYVFPIQ